VRGGGDRALSEPLQPPGGEPPPAETTMPDGSVVAIGELAHEICRRYAAEFPDEQRRYGDTGMAWCQHDNQWILYWALEDVAGIGDLDHHLAALAGALADRDFPVERLARDLEIAADVAAEDQEDGLSARLSSAAESLAR
jgi:hypothetical protein